MGAGCVCEESAGNRLRASRASLSGRPCFQRVVTVAGRLDENFARGLARGGQRRSRQDFGRTKKNIPERLRLRLAQ